MFDNPLVSMPKVGLAVTVNVPGPAVSVPAAVKLIAMVAVFVGLGVAVIGMAVGVSAMIYRVGLGRLIAGSTSVAH